MKKKFILFLTIFLSLTSLTACGSKRPNNIREEVYEYGLRAVEITEDFFSAEISVDDARDKMGIISDSISTLDPENSYEQLLATNVATLRLAFMNAAIRESATGSVPSENMEDIRDYLDDLKEKLELN